MGNSATGTGQSYIRKSFSEVGSEFFNTQQKNIIKLTGYAAGWTSLALGEDHPHGATAARLAGLMGDAKNTLSVIELPKKLSELKQGAIDLYKKDPSVAGAASFLFNRVAPVINTATDSFDLIVKFCPVSEALKQNVKKYNSVATLCYAGSGTFHNGTAAIRSFQEGKYTQGIGNCIDTASTVSYVFLAVIQLVNGKQAKTWHILACITSGVVFSIGGFFYVRLFTDSPLARHVDRERVRAVHLAKAKVEKDFETFEQETSDKAREIAKSCVESVKNLLPYVSDSTSFSLKLHGLSTNLNATLPDYTAISDTAIKESVKIGSEIMVQAKIESDQKYLEQVKTYVDVLQKLTALDEEVLVNKNNSAMDQLTGIQNGLLAHPDQADRYAKQLKELAVMINTRLNEKINSLKSDLSEANKKLNQSATETEKGLRVENKGLKDKLEEANKKLTEIEANMKKLVDEKKKLKEDSDLVIKTREESIEGLKTQLFDANKENDKLKNETVPALNTKIEELTEERDGANKHLENLKALNVKLLEAQQKLTEEKIQLTGKLSLAEEKLGTAGEENTKQLEEIKALKESLIQNENELKKVQGQLKAIAREFNVLEKNVEEGLDLSLPAVKQMFTRSHIVLDEAVIGKQESVDQVEENKEGSKTPPRAKNYREALTTNSKLNKFMSGETNNDNLKS
jgi:hypothetical protein